MTKIIFIISLTLIFTTPCWALITLQTGDTLEISQQEINDDILILGGTLRVTNNSSINGDIFMDDSESILILQGNSQVNGTVNCSLCHSLFINNSSLKSLSANLDTLSVSNSSMHDVSAKGRDILFQSAIIEGKLEVVDSNLVNISDTIIDSKGKAIMNNVVELILASVILTTDELIVNNSEAFAAIISSFIITNKSEFKDNELLFIDGNVFNKNGTKIKINKNLNTDVQNNVINGLLDLKSGEGTCRENNNTYLRFKGGCN